MHTIQLQYVMGLGVKDRTAGLEGLVGSFGYGELHPHGAVPVTGLAEVCSTR